MELKRIDNFSWNYKISNAIKIGLLSGSFMCTDKWAQGAILIGFTKGYENAQNKTICM